VFTTLGNTFNVDPNKFRLVVLLFLSLLIEYIVYSLSPTTKMNRKLLYDYREFIDDDINVEELLDGFDKEIQLYLGVTEKEMIKAESAPDTPSVKEIVEAIKETKEPELEFKPVEVIPVETVIEKPLEKPDEKI
jgi:hypothetical protein